MIISLFSEAYFYDSGVDMIVQRTRQAECKASQFVEDGDTFLNVIPFQKNQKKLKSIIVLIRVNGYIFSIALKKRQHLLPLFVYCGLTKTPNGVSL